MIAVLIAGASSRLARATRRHFAALDGFEVTGLVRRPEPAFAGEKLIEIADHFGPPTSLLAMDCVVNFAGIGGDAPRAALAAANVEGPLRLARAAKMAGARQFVTISSSHVYGRAREIGAATPEAPVSLYGESKRTADAALLALQDSDFTVTVLRLPMVYGPGLGESLRGLARLMARTGFLPSPSRPVRRSLLHADNFAHALAFAIRRRLGGVLRLADTEPLSFDVLAELVSRQAGRSVRLARWPSPVLRPLLALKPALHDRLYADCVFRQEDCLVPATPYPVALRAGLKEFLAA
jgi:UDP-glucose 4-epimerase